MQMLLVVGVDDHCITKIITGHNIDASAAASLPSEGRILKATRKAMRVHVIAEADDAHETRRYPSNGLGSDRQEPSSSCRAVEARMHPRRLASSVPYPSRLAVFAFLKSFRSSPTICPRPLYQKAYYDLQPSRCSTGLSSSS